MTFNVIMLLLRLVIGSFSTKKSKAKTNRSLYARVFPALSKLRMKISGNC